MSSSFKQIIGRHATPLDQRGALYNTQSTRALEHAAAAKLPEHTLMQRAGLALAQFTLAVAPHAQTIWIACGPGNNGGDGLEAAMHLQRWGKTPLVSFLAPTTYPTSHPMDAACSLQRALQAGVAISNEAPLHFDACIDALFGIGSQRPLQGAYAQWVERINQSATHVIAADIPTGLDADTGQAAKLHVRASHTLSLLGLKPGLFTADGRDACGDIWWHDLGVDSAVNPSAWLNPAPALAARQHNSHKGSFGDVVVVGGASSMEGAALLAATAALQGGAGRVYVAGVGDAPPMQVNPLQPELMFKPLRDLKLEHQTVVAGCGGGEAICAHLEHLLRHAAWLVLDADALNAIALEPSLQCLLQQRPPHSTVLTPHPLEAARLANSSTAHIQYDRLTAAKTLAQRFGCAVVLKGSGTVIAAPDCTPHINSTGNALLATAGTGDVLAGLTGALLGMRKNAFDAACEAVYWHGWHADQWLQQSPQTRQTQSC